MNSGQSMTGLGERLDSPRLGMKTAAFLAMASIVTILVAVWIGAHPVSDATLATRINPNTADEALLQTLPNIGPARARAIVEYRHGIQKGRMAFQRVEDLQNVKGIGPATIRTLSPWLTLETDDQTMNGIVAHGD